MSYSLLQLLFIGALTAGGGLLAALITPQHVINKHTLTRIAMAWVGILVIAFVGGSSTVFLLGTSVVLLWLRRQAPAPLLFGIMLLTVPCIYFELSGLGPVNKLLAISYPRLLLWLVLLPALIMAPKPPKEAAFGAISSDYLLLGSGLLVFLLQLPGDSITNGLRVFVYFLSDAFLVYYTFSRLVTDELSLRQALWGVTLGIMLICPVAMFEFSSHWLLYDGLATSLGVPTVFSYITRGGTGWVRAISSTGQPLVLGYVTALAGIIYLGLAEPGKKKTQTHWWLMGLACIMGGLFASISRGMWMGFAFGLLVWLATGPGAAQKIIQVVVATTLLLMVAAMTPAGQSVIDTLPFIGTSDQQNVDYRKDLITISVMVVRENLFFGSFDYLNHPLMQSLIQGQGIIDVVNTFLGYALTTGMVGLSLFMLPFLITMYGLFQRIRQHEDANLPMARLGRALLSALMAVMLMISTTSSVGVIQMVYWMLLGLGTAFNRIHDQAWKAVNDAPAALDKGLSAAQKQAPVR